MNKYTVQERIEIIFNLYVALHTTRRLWLGLVRNNFASIRIGVTVVMMLRDVIVIWAVLNSIELGQDFQSWFVWIIQLKDKCISTNYSVKFNSIWRWKCASRGYKRVSWFSSVRQWGRKRMYYRLAAWMFWFACSFKTMCTFVGLYLSAYSNL
jgi:hypothetical protein